MLFSSKKSQNFFPLLHVRFPHGLRHCRGDAVLVQCLELLLVVQQHLTGELADCHDEGAWILHSDNLVSRPDEDSGGGIEMIDLD